MRSFEEQRPFKDLLLADAEVMAVLSSADVEKAFDLHVQLRHVDEIIDRVFRVQGVPEVPKVPEVQHVL
jgi:adenylosuccinate lyase